MGVFRDRLRKLRPEGRTVVLICDYFAWPVCSHPGREPLPPEDLPIGAGLRAALAEWAAAYDDRLVRGDIFAEDDDFVRALEADAHDAAGRRLWRELQRELGRRWRVGYLNEDGAIEWP